MNRSPSKPNPRLKKISCILSSTSLFCVAFLMIGYVFQIQHTLYGLFHNLFGGMYLLVTPVAIIFAAMALRGIDWNVRSWEFLYLVMAIVSLAFIFLPI